MTVANSRSVCPIAPFCPALLPDYLRWIWAAIFSTVCTFFCLFGLSDACGESFRVQKGWDQVPRNFLIDDENIRINLGPEDKTEEALRVARRHFGTTFDRVGPLVAIYMLKKARLKVQDESIVDSSPGLADTKVSLIVEEVDLNDDGRPEILFHISPADKPNESIAEHYVFAAPRLSAKPTDLVYAEILHVVGSTLSVTKFRDKDTGYPHFLARRGSICTIHKWPSIAEEFGYQEPGTPVPCNISAARYERLDNELVARVFGALPGRADRPSLRRYIRWNELGVDDAGRLIDPDGRVIAARVRKISISKSAKSRFFAFRVQLRPDFDLAVSTTLVVFDRNARGQHSDFSRIDDDDSLSWKLIIGRVPLLISRGESCRAFPMGNLLSGDARDDFGDGESFDCRMSDPIYADIKNRLKRAVLASSSVPTEIAIDSVLEAAGLTVDGFNRLVAPKLSGALQLKLLFEPMPDENGRRTSYWRMRLITAETSELAPVSRSSIVMTFVLRSIARRTSLILSWHSGEAIQILSTADHARPQFMSKQNDRCFLLEPTNGRVDGIVDHFYYDPRSSDCASQWRVLVERKQACESEGGKWSRQGLRQAYGCVKRTSDAGKECKNSSECEQGCIDVGKALESDGSMFGACRGTTSPFGCFFNIENGKRVGGRCVD